MTDCAALDIARIGPYDDLMSEKELERGERAGPWMWSSHGLRIEIVENTLDLADLQPIVEAIQPELAAVDIRRKVAGPMASPLTPETAVALAFVIAAHGFLQELGKDAYVGFRAGVLAAYRKAKTWANGRGYWPLRVERYDMPRVIFLFDPSMTNEAFDAAFKAFCEFPSGSVVSPPFPSFVVLKFDDDPSGTWRVDPDQTP